MPERFDFIALRRIHQPDTLLYPYDDGAGVPANAVREWGLIIGEDVRPTRDDVIARPESGASRSEWEAYAIGQGWSLEDAREASMKDLRGVPERDPNEPARDLPDPGAPSDRPAESAVKADWVQWAVRNGADEDWANDKATTKADLMEYQPPGTAETGPDEQPTDTVAAAANDANG